jgi:hypothetical protein
MRRFLAVFANFSVCAEAASQAYSLTLDLSTSKRHFLCFIKMSEDPEGVESVSRAQGKGIRGARILLAHLASRLGYT